MKYLPVFLLVVGCNPFNWYPDTSFEESLEQKIQQQTGIRIDLSGDTPDQDDKK